LSLPSCEQLFPSNWRGRLASLLAQFPPRSILCAAGGGRSDDSPVPAQVFSVWNGRFFLLFFCHPPLPPLSGWDLRSDFFALPRVVEGVAFVFSTMLPEFQSPPIWSPLVSFFGMFYDGLFEDCSFRLRFFLASFPRVGSDFLTP